MTPFKPVRPLKIEQTSPTELIITWDDGLQTRHGFVELRYQCQCASCREELTGRPLIRREEIADDIYPLRIVPVGSYGLRVHWSDGHDLGIYAFDQLRHMAAAGAE